MPRNKRTVADAMQDVKELQERAAVTKTLSGYLRMRYLPRDSLPASAQIRCGGSVVSEDTIEEMARELDEGAKEIDKEAKALARQEVAVAED